MRVKVYNSAPVYTPVSHFLREDLDYLAEMVFFTPYSEPVASEKG
jgi:hypothetical protein